MKFGCYQTLWNTSVGRFSAEMRVEGPYVQKLLIPKTGDRFLINCKYCRPRTRNNNFAHRRGDNAGYSVHIHGTKKREKCSIRVGAESQNPVLYSDEKRPSHAM